MKVVYKNEEYEVKTEEKRVNEIFKEDIENSEKKIIACKINNEVKTLNFEVKENDTVELVDISDRDGRKIYIRGLLYIMAMAFDKLYPNIKLIVNHQLSNAMFCESENVTFTFDMLKKVENEMKSIIEKRLPIEKREMTRQEATKFYEEHDTDIGKLQLDNKKKEVVSLYFCEEYFNYFYGVLPISTGDLGLFKLEKYHNGFLLRYPSRKEPNKMSEYKETKKLLATLREYEDIHKILEVETVQKFNKFVRAGKAKDLILLDEALHEKKLAQIADNVAKNRNIKMVLIAGPSSSGKTTFAKRLGVELRLNGLKVVTISVDNYFVERDDTPKDENGKFDFECIEAIDLDLFNRNLTDLLAGKEIDMPTFNFQLGKKEFRGNKMKLADDEILVIEGIHCLNDRLTQSIPKKQKYKVYISALTVLNLDRFNRISTTDTRLIRRMVRDYQFRGYSALNTLKQWSSVNAGEEKNIYPFQEDADSMFNTSLIYELAVLKTKAVPLLNEIDNTMPEYAEAKRIREFLNYFEEIDPNDVLNNSLLKEFMGGSIFGDE